MNDAVKLVEEHIRTAVEMANRENTIVVVAIPIALLESSREVEPHVTTDYDIRAYRQIFAPDLSASRIREQCAAKEFPDTTMPDGTIVPGAYKDGNGAWRITREGIRARQERERRAGLESRQNPGFQIADSASDPSSHQPGAADDACERAIEPATHDGADRRSDISTAAASGARPIPRPRSKEGEWRKVRGGR